MIRFCVAALLPLALLVYAGAGRGATAAELDAAISLGMDWVAAHPATSDDGGFTDLVDEGLFHLTVRRTLGAAELSGELDSALRDWSSRLLAAPGWRQDAALPWAPQLILHYHRLLAAHLLDQVGRETPDKPELVGAAQRALGASGGHYPTFRLTVALLLQHLGADPVIAPESLLGSSAISRMLQESPPAPSNWRHPLFYYAVVHEVAALTDFGNLPPGEWLLQRRDAIGRQLIGGVHQAMATGQVDLLAELLLCLDMLGLANGELLRDGSHYLISRQQTDGSWGEQVQSSRENRVRHAVQTATAALIRYRSLSAAGSSPD